MKLQNVKVVEDSKLILMTQEQIDAQKSVLKEIIPGVPQYKTAEGYDVIAVLVFDGFAFPIRRFCDLLWQAIRQFHVQSGRESLESNGKERIKEFICRTYSLHNRLVYDVYPIPKEMNYSRALCIDEELSILAEIIDMKSSEYQELLRKARLAEKKEEDLNGSGWITIKGERITKGFLGNIIDHGAQYLLNDASTTGRGFDRITDLLSDAIAGLLLVGHFSGLDRKKNVERAVKYLAPWDFTIDSNSQIINDYFL